MATLPSPDTVAHADELLSQLAVPQSEAARAVVLSRLCNLYDTSNVVTQYKIVNGLIETRFVETRSLLHRALLDNPSALVRHEAAFGLGVLRIAADTDMLIKAMLSDKDAMVRHEAAVALGTLCQRTSLPALNEALNDPEPAVVDSAAFAIAEITLQSTRANADSSL